MKLSNIPKAIQLTIDKDREYLILDNLTTNLIWFYYIDATYAKEEW